MPPERHSLNECLIHNRTPIKGKQATPVLRTLDGQPITALFGISEAATEGREKKHLTKTRSL